MPRNKGYCFEDLPIEIRLPLQTKPRLSELWDPWIVIACGIFVIIYLYIVCNYDPEIYLLN